VWHPGAVTIVALDPDDRMLLVRQWRVAAGRSLLELPAGTLDVVGGKPEDPEAAARRELEEETGYRARTWRKGSTFWTAPGFATELMHLFLASDLEPAHEGRLGPDEDERLELRRATLDEALGLIDDGTIADAKSIVGILALQRERAGTPRSGVHGPDHVQVRFALSTRDHVLSSAALSRMSLGTTLLGAVISLAGVLPLANGDWLPAIPSLLFGALIVMGFLTAPFIWWAARKRPELVSSPMTFEADEDGLVFEGVFGRSHAAWDTVRRVRRSSGYLFLDTGVGQNFVIAERAMDAEQRARFERLLLRRGMLPDGSRVTPPRR
jgi:ADP-ribose pyrophosphatase